jgi:PIN domain nuclease of toxin-antitoxin system
VKAFLDTHAAVALCEGRHELFGRRAADLLERSALFVSPVVRLELGFLDEIGRIDAGADEILGALASDLGVVISDDPFQAIVGQAMSFSWTHDPFDRLLVATALLHKAPLITRDQQIRENFKDAVW